MYRRAEYQLITERMKEPRKFIQVVMGGGRQTGKSTISRHIRNVFESGELKPDSTVAFFATVQNEGNRKVERSIAYYNLDIIISVGYRVNSHRGVQFRIWATQVLREYIVKGFAMNDDLLKRAGGGNYFDEQRTGGAENMPLSGLHGSFCKTCCSQVFTSWPGLKNPPRRGVPGAGVNPSSKTSATPACLASA